MTPEQANQLIDDLYAATGSGDWEKAESMLTDDLVIVEADGLPMAGTYTGIHALQDLYKSVFATLQVESLHIVARCFGGDYAVCILKMYFGNGLEPAELTEVFKFRDGKVCEIKPYYFDPAPVKAAAK